MDLAFLIGGSYLTFVRQTHSAPKMRRKKLPIRLKKPGFFFAAGGVAAGLAPAPGVAAVCAGSVGCGSAAGLL
jgi:hypothetical protein